MTDLLLYTLGGLIFGSPGLVLMAVVRWRPTSPEPTSKESLDEHANA